MSVTEVQQFLNRQVPNCWLGRPGYEIGKPVQWGGPTKLASKCLKDFRINTTTQVADAYCAAIPGIRNESAASVIVRVSQACGISPKVLLVMLDKEQSLVSDPWPNENQYFLAMGYACPDSGPGNTANCDPSRGGFAKQVYRAAWQFKVYKALSNSYRYKPFQNNYIQWHPNASCGGSTVHIENYATAGLYIYTPYRPNQAALNAGWGEGNACSSYGNRNFYNFYKAWFGTPSITVHDRFTGLFGSLKSTLGDVTANAVDIAGGLRQELEKGTMFWHPAVGAYAVKGGIKTYFDSLGGVTGQLGFPRTREYSVSGGYYQEFQNGIVSYASSKTRFVVKGSIRAHFLGIGGFDKAGFARGPERRVGQGYYQEFDRGWVTSLNGYGRAFVTGDLLQSYKAQGGPASLGYPSSSAKSSQEGQWQEFQSATLFQAKSGKVIPVRGSIRKYQAVAGGVGATGFPLKAERKMADGTWVQEFAKGTIYWKYPDGAFLKPGKMKEFVDSSGLGDFGAQVGRQIDSADGAVQEFTNVTLYWSARNGYVPVRGSIRKYQAVAGGVGATGFPLKAERKMADGTWVQEFAKGTIYWKYPDGAFLKPGKMKEFVDSSGLGDFGAQVGRQIDSADGAVQEFTNVTLYWSARNGYVPVRGSIRKYQAVAGGVGATGFPLKAERKMADGTWVQEFAKGTIYWKYPNGKFESLRAQPFHSPPVEPDTDTLASDSIPDQVDTAPQGDEESAQVEPPAQEDSIVEG